MNDTGRSGDALRVRGIEASTRSVDVLGRSGSLRTFSILIVALLVSITLVGCDTNESSSSDSPNSVASDPLPPSSEVSRVAVEKLCGHCHLFPEPEWLTQKAWRETIIDMSKMSDYTLFYPDRPSTEDVINWYVERAPKEFIAPQGVAFDAVERGIYEKTSIQQVFDKNELIGISSLRSISLPRPNSNQQLLVGDMQSGGVIAIDRVADRVREIAALSNPARLNVVDLDRDGLNDILAAELGAPLPQDHNLGQVVWIRQLASGEFEPYVLNGGLGRVADAQAADFDRDGDLDLVVAEFGWRITGHVIVLENQTEDWATPQFQRKIIDGRNGAVRVECLDLNHDGLEDFVALIAQGHEMLVAYLNQGDMRFESKILHRAPHPAWGYCALEAVDLDGDGDVDFVLGNGDTLDNSELKPFYEIAWLENRGQLEFEYHSITEMFGVMALEAKDLDGDGDLDIAASAFAPTQGQTGFADLNLASLIWLEQTENGVFKQHVLEINRLTHLSLAIEDLDKDGKLDIAVGNGGMAGPDPSVELWRRIGQVEKQ